MMNTYYFDMDGVIANFHKAYATNKATALSRKAMAELEPFTEAIKVVKALINGGATVYINSLAANENGKAGKLEWLAKYLPEVDEEHIIIITDKTKKGEHMKEAGILVDDKKQNCREWEKLTGQPSIWVEERGKVILS
jgi:5'(3')-deoxyribonucleotidase